MNVVLIDVLVLINGDMGVGKELIVCSLYELLLCCDKLFIVVNCGVLFELMFELEMFGYEFGVFIGVVKWCVGKFEYVFGGMLFFDEIESMLFVL